MSRPLPPDKLARFLTGQSPPDEDAEVRSWLESDPNARLELEGIRGGDRRRVVGFPRQARITNLWTAPVRVAAVLVLLAALGSVLLQRYAARTTTEPLATYVTKPGEMMTIRLPDGTRVDLSFDSRLEVGVPGAGGERRIGLQGRAFFSVVSDGSRPFVVETPSSTVTVLGTSFDVDAYPGSESARVVVTEGRVAFTPASGSGATLEAGQVGVLDLRGNPDVIRVASADTAALTAWRRGRIVFRDTPLHEAAVTLSRWYDADVILTDFEISGLRVDGVFADQSLPSVVESICDALDLSCSISDERVALSPKQGARRP